MLGSAFEAEDAVQETMVRAWRGRASFEGRSSVRAWLYRIATNVCLDLLAGRSRRALPAGLGPRRHGRVRPERPESTWLQPAPDAMVLDIGADPADVAVARASVRLAFVAALQHLPPRQRAVLILRDVLRWSAADVAVLLDTSETAVHSALARARATLGRHGGAADSVPDRLDDEHRALLDRYVDAFERYDVDSLVALLHEDATLSMPPITLLVRRPGRHRGVVARRWRGVPRQPSGRHPGQRATGVRAVPRRRRRSRRLRHRPPRRRRRPDHGHRDVHRPRAVHAVRPAGAPSPVRSIP